MAFSLIWNPSIKAEKSSVVIDFNISNVVRREPDNYPGLPDGLEIMVYRKEADGFNYNIQREDYFETEDFDEAMLVFSGKPERKTENMFRWTDKDVEYNKLYTYWLSTPLNDRPLSPKAVRVVDNNVIWTHKKTLAEARRIAADYKGVTYENFGYSVKAR